MRNPIHHLDAQEAAAGAAIANARAGRRGAPAIANVLEILPDNLLAEVMEDARAALAAAAAIAAATPPKVRASGALRAEDASALALDLGAGTLAILARDRTKRANAVFWAAGLPAAVLGHDEAEALWSALAAVLRTLPDHDPAEGQHPEEPTL